MRPNLVFVAAAWCLLASTGNDIKTALALMAPIPTGWEEVQPDGNTTIRLFHRGHEVGQPYITNTHGHPIVVDKDGWYVYGNANVTTRELHPTRLRVGIHDPPTLTETEKKAHLHDSQNGLAELDDIKNDDDKRHGRHLNLFERSGNPRCLVLLVKFEDQANRDMPPRTDYDELFNSIGSTNNKIVKIGSVREAFRINSLNKLDLEFDVVGWNVVPGTEERWSFGRNGLMPKFSKVAYPVLDQMDAKGTDWSRYDSDGNGEMDCFVVVHSGYSAEGGGTDCINGRPMGTHRIWSHAPNLPPVNQWQSRNESIRVTKYAAISGVFGSCGNDIARVAAPVHELGHNFGVEDLTGRPGQGRGPGYFDVMGMPWGFDGTQNYPNLMGAWSRIQIGWFEPKPLTRPGVYTIRPAQMYPDVYKITHGYPAGEYLLVEYRPKIYFDMLIPGESGLLIWHIDENNQQRVNGNNGHPGQRGWPSNGNHHRVALLQADGLYQLEREINFGDEGDPWTPGMELLPGPARNNAVPGGNYPNSDSYQGGEVAFTGNKIFNIRKVGENMQFSYTKVPGANSNLGSTLGLTLGGPPRLRKRKLQLET